MCSGGWVTGVLFSLREGTGQRMDLWFVRTCISCTITGTGLSILALVLKLLVACCWARSIGMERVIAREGWARSIFAARVRVDCIV